MRHASTTPPRKGVSARLSNLISLVHKPAPAVGLQDHGPRDTDIRDLQKRGAGAPPDYFAPPALKPMPPLAAVTRTPCVAREPPPPPPPPVVSHTRRGPQGDTVTRRASDECGAVVDIFRNGKPPRKRRPTAGADKPGSDRTEFEDEDYRAFDKLPGNKRECLYFVAQVKGLVSPESTVIDYLSRIDLVKVNKLMLLTRALGVNAGDNSDQQSDAPPSPAECLVKRKSDPEDAFESIRKKARQTVERGPHSVFSFGESPHHSAFKGGAECDEPASHSDNTAGMNTPLPLTRNSNASLFMNFGTSMPISSAAQSCAYRLSEQLNDPMSVQMMPTAAQPTPAILLPAPVCLKMEPGAMDFLTFVREKCYSYSQVRRMCVADGVLKDPQICSLIANTSEKTTLPLKNLARLKYLTMVLAEMGNKLESAFNDFLAVEVRRKEQLCHVARAEKFVRKCFLIKLTSDIRSPAEAELNYFTRKVFAATFEHLAVSDLLNPDKENISARGEVFMQHIGSAPDRIEMNLRQVYALDNMKPRLGSTVGKMLESLQHLRMQNLMLKRSLKEVEEEVTIMAEEKLRQVENVQRIETDHRQATKRIMFDEDGVDVFLRRAQAELRSFFVARLNETRNKRAIALGEASVLANGEEPDGWSGTTHLDVPETFAQYWDVPRQRSINLFAGVELSKHKPNEREESLSPLARLADFEPDSTTDAEETYSMPDQKWWLYQMNRVPLTPVKRKSEEYFLRDRETPVPQRARESVS